MTSLLHSTDLQATAPSIALGLDEVGVTGIVRGISLGTAGVATTARFDVATSLAGSSRGAHMSRFHEAIDHALELVGDGGRDVPSLELLAAVVASRAAELQEAARGRAEVRATVAWPRVAPASGRRTVDPFETWARVEVDRTDGGAVSTRVTLGVAAVGMTACPCAQNLVREAARGRLEAKGLDEATIETVLATLPVATHNQRSTGVLELTVPGDAAVMAVAEPVDLADLVRASMSAQVHELLKRDDELAVVEAAHADPRFVEDCVRALLRDVATAGGLVELPAATVVTVRQVNHESIHAHDVVATRTATLGDLREALGVEAAPAPA